MKLCAFYFHIMFLFFLFATGPANGSNLFEFEGLLEPNELVNVGTPVEGVNNLPLASFL